MNLIWPDEVQAMIAALGKTPAHSCPLIEARAENDAAQILDAFDPAQVRSWLDIGCGLAVVDTIIAMLMPGARVHLLDGAPDAPAVLDAGYKAVMAPWNRAEIGAAMVRANAANEVVTHAPAPFDIEVDLVFSTRSWGHHYPVSTYLPSVVRSLRPGGRLVVDLRTGKGGRAEIEAAGFTHVATVDQNTVKCSREVFRRHE